MRRTAVILTCSLACFLFLCHHAFAAGEAAPPADQDVEALKGQLRSGKMGDRINAAKTLAGMKSQPAFDALVEGLKFREQELRLEIIKGLATFNKPEVITAFTGQFNTCTDDCKLAMFTAVSGYKDMGEEALFILALKDKSDRVRSEAIAQLNTRRDKPGVLDAFLLLMDRGDPLSRRSIVGAVPPATTNEQEIAILKKGLADRDADVVRTALDVLKDIQLDPDNKADLVLTVRKFPDRSVRQAQIEVLQKIATARAVQQLISLLRGEKDAGVIQKILRALGSIGQKADADAAAKGISDYTHNPELKTRLAAVEALGKINNNDTSKQTLIKALSDKELEIVRAAILGLGGFKTPDIVDRIVEASIRTGDFGVQNDVVKILAGMDDPEAVDGLLKLLDRGHPNCAGQILIALGDKKAPQAVVPITAQIQKRLDAKTDQDRRFLQAAAEALRKIGGPETEQSLILLAQSSAIVARLDALAALGDFRSDAATECLIHALSDGEFRVRQTALTSIKRSLDPAAVDAVEKLLDDPLKEIRLTAIETLGLYGLPRSAARIARDFGDDKLNRAAVAALANMDSKDAKLFLIKALDTPDLPTRRNALRGLGLSWAKGDDDVVNAIKELLKKESDRQSRDTAFMDLGNAATDDAMRRLTDAALAKGDDSKAAIAALGLTGAEAASDILVELIPQLGYESRMLAIDAIGRIGNEKAIEPLTKLSEASDPPIRIAAIKALGRYNSLAAKVGLMKFLKDTTPSVLKTAMITLTKYADSADVRMTVIQLSGSDKPEIRQAAVESMPYYASPDMVQALIARMRDDSKPVAVAALKSIRRLLNRDLGENDASWSVWWNDHRDKPVADLVNSGFTEMKYEIGDPAARKTVEEYIRALGDANDFIRFNAIARLRALTGEDFGFDPDKEVNKEAVDKWNKWWQNNKEKFNQPNSGAENGGGTPEEKPGPEVSPA